MNSIWRFSDLNPEPLEIKKTYGAIRRHDVPLLPGGIIAVECTENTTGRMYQPSSSTDPYVRPHLEWELSAQTLTGSMARSATATLASTNPQWNGLVSVTTRESGKILGFGVEAAQTGQVNRQGRLTTNTLQQQTMVTTPSQIVSGCELHRVIGRPDLSMNMSGSASSPG